MNRTTRTVAAWLLLAGFAAMGAVGCTQPNGNTPSAAGSPPPGLAAADEVTNGLSGTFYDDGGDGDVRTRSGSSGFLASLALAPLPPFHPGSDELWVFSEAPRGASRPKQTDRLGSAQMVGRASNGVRIDLPLRHTDVRADVVGHLAAVDVTQQFHNPYGEKIEAIYVFPLPEDAAVRDFVLAIGDRRIRGMIRSRAEAARIYTAARDQGYHAALLEQERPNVFEQAIANIEPGHEIDVQLQYVHTLAYGGGAYEFVFPMVVGPRYNPAGWNDGIGAAGSPNGERSGQPTEVVYLPPGIAGSNDVDIAVDVDAGLPIGAIESPSHRVAVARPAADHASVRLEGAVPDRDFVLRIEVGGHGCRAGMLTQGDGDGGHLTLMLHPPEELRDLPRQPLELVFVIDCSGSMQGAPLAQAKAAVELALQRLEPEDSLQLIRFGNEATGFASRPVSATPSNLTRVRDWLRRLQADGGTEMLAGMRAALDDVDDSRRLRFVAFLTDGFIGNESEVFAAVRQRIGRSRIFSLGVGSSVNRHLLEGIARIGRGAAGYLLHDEEPGRAVAQLYDRIAHPALTDVEVDWGGADVDEVFPARLPDLFAGRPIVLNARYRGAPPEKVRVRGRIGGREIEIDVATTAVGARDRGVLAAAWARRKLQSLVDYADVLGARSDRRGAEALALEHNLMSPFTSFVAVDASGATVGDHGWTMPVPSPVPAGVRYDTAVGK